MMRRIVVAGAVLAAVGLSPGGAGAAPEDPFVFHFKGRAALSTVLTDCPPAPAPVGTECRAVSVFAAEQRVKEDGQPVGGAFVSTTLFDVTITGGNPPFVAVPIGDGFTEDASVQITGLTRGAASAVDVSAVRGVLRVCARRSGVGLGQRPVDRFRPRRHVDVPREDRGRGLLRQLPQQRPTALRRCGG